MIISHYDVIYVNPVIISLISAYSQISIRREAASRKNDYLLKENVIQVLKSRTKDSKILWTLFQNHNFESAYFLRIHV